MKSATRPSASGEAWIRKTLRSLTLEEKLGQLLMIPYFGEFLSEKSPGFLELVREVEQNHIGGLMVHTGTGPLGIRRSQAYPAAALAQLLQRRAKVPLVIAGDFERGTAMRLTEGTSFPHAMAVAATGRPEDAYTMGRLTAQEARSVGAPWIFAPVADVNSNPENPIINIRSFGEDPERVSPYVAAYVRGVEENGGLATAKHFPGHGDTSVDSHIGMPVVGADRAHLERVELATFRAAIEAGVSTIMTGHLAVPALEPDRTVPATLSKRITTDLLRRRLGFRGLIVTDSLDMGGVAADYSLAEAAVRAILAGADALLVPPPADVPLAALREAIASGRLPVSRVNDAVRHVLHLKSRLEAERRSRVSLERLGRQFGRPDSSRTAQDIADRGVTLLRDQRQLLPLDATRPVRILLAAIAGDPDTFPGQHFEDEIRWRADSLQVLRADTRFRTVESLDVPVEESYDTVVVALFVRVADRKGSVGLPDNQVAYVKRLLAGKKPTIIACFGSPYLIARFPEAKTWLAAFSNADTAQRAAVRAMFGQVATHGRIPVTVPDVVRRGAGLDVCANPMKSIPGGPAVDERLTPAYEMLDRAVAGGAFPGGVLAVGHRGRLAIHTTGKQSTEANATEVTPGTIYDTASLTKPVVTTTLTAMLAESGLLDLDAPLTRYLPEWSAGAKPDPRNSTRPRHLLTHTSGLPAHEEYFRTSHTRREILEQVISARLAYEPGARSVYSDLGFILLSEIIERLTGKPLDQLARERIFAPLDMGDTFFNPPKALRARIAPTERDSKYRKRLLCGEVHDENAWAMGGVAGHAGMFSTAADLAVFCQMLLNGGLYAHRRLLRRQTIAQFTEAQPITGNTRALGWTVPTENSSSGRYFGPHSFGHTGFTGTSLWVDPDRQLFVVLLTNRVHPSRTNEQIQQVRPALHDAVIEALAPDAG